MFGIGEKPVAAVVVNGARENDAPFCLQYAPGLVLCEAEIRDRASLAVFIATVQALGALLPETAPEPAMAQLEPARETLVDVTPLRSPKPEEEAPTSPPAEAG